ncbi:MAG: ATP synthase F1 subunit gamma [Candidatus Kerfeldbacteria bacterium CG15_BIG_FIL_POST_REV_8_21_14_020_45_12]|uniref:ATP synthase gamma chain n=1 Tax=Candidatus Kerfeldbacteria bacterium CG15_BIG_FIL_POST_REV_8_21_14_020_45_12 TaxID=2014247 RepID=A0A2M7H4I6_9BACT|nr:MAG: ATP synthase F1 subunit gamma [Candidatus Kerfeldbacteria bacterium CG15_BIG_FIL_POST_REV_8_21_14_020_45_12]PJA92933.1 MAG: ATP synthase F1 subunit gamma [Candidatus Kerfeldbacteria bacterium CG_4_9_14_3_um_filter_45_8]
MASPKEIKGRIHSIKNTQKTTKAMELVSGAKMRKAVQATNASREYQRISWSIAQRIRSNTKTDIDLSLLRFFTEPNSDDKKIKTTILAFTSNRGLCGSFNSNVIKSVSKYVQENPNEDVSVVGIGKKGIAMLNSIGIKPTLAYPKDDTAASDESVREVAGLLYKKFVSGEIDRVIIAYTDFVSALVQNPQLKTLYPLPSEEPESTTDIDETAKGDLLYTYEPSAVAVLDFLIPRIAEVELYQALLESNASEHSARMLAMKNATEAASEMKDDLTLAYNRARQAAITKEIAEIAAGTAAVS